MYRIAIIALLMFTTQSILGQRAVDTRESLPLEEKNILAGTSVSPSEFLPGGGSSGSKTSDSKRSWSFFNQKKEIVLAFHYQDGTLMKAVNLLSVPLSVPVLQEGTYRIEEVESPPLYLGNPSDFTQLLQQEFPLKKSVREANCSGLFQASLVIGPQGQLQSITADKVPFAGMETAFLSALGRLQGGWLPAVKDGQGVSSKVLVLMDLQSFPDTECASHYTTPYLQKPGVFVVTRKLISERATTVASAQ
ncbi:MAG: hypothetical protein HKN61_05470 [Flavobacteriaceae bacterium]|nr:hypothetical protein [Flavobacteriaceae bacterium]